MDQPDPDAIKMFVGQIPRSWTETELKELFEPFGAVYQINILRDRAQNPPQSKGTLMGPDRLVLWFLMIQLVNAGLSLDLIMSLGCFYDSTAVFVAILFIN